VRYAHAALESGQHGRTFVCDDTHVSRTIRHVRSVCDDTHPPPSGGYLLSLPFPGFNLFSEMSVADLRSAPLQVSRRAPQAPRCNSG
jgi:hypothetical protein